MIITFLHHKYILIHSFIRQSINFYDLEYNLFILMGCIYLSTTKKVSSVIDLSINIDDNHNKQFKFYRYKDFVNIYQIGMAPLQKGIN